MAQIISVSNQNGVNTIALNSKTIERANVIAQRLGSAAMGVAKALMIELLEAKLDGIAHIIFQKKDGTLREMYCTTNTSLISKYIVGCNKKTSYGTKVVWDVEKCAFRSFRLESLVKVF